MQKARLLLTSTLLLLFTLGNAWAAERINTLEKQGLFSYQPSGKDQFTTEWQGATWKFSSQEHLDLFTTEPGKYAPQYGGYCAYGVAQNNLVKIEPDQWTIHDDKLYLNYNAKLNKEWKKDIPGYIDTADKLFESLLETQ